MTSAPPPINAQDKEYLAKIEAGATTVKALTKAFGLLWPNAVGPTLIRLEKFGLIARVGDTSPLSYRVLPRCDHYVAKGRTCAECVDPKVNAAPKLVAYDGRCEAMRLVRKAHAVATRCPTGAHDVREHDSVFYSVCSTHRGKPDFTPYTLATRFRRREQNKPAPEPSSATSV